MNWGYKITFALFTFMSFIGYLVYGAFQEDFDLVSEDYYRDEINHQQTINRMMNVKNSQKVTLTNNEKSVILNFPTTNASGTIHFYHPSSKQLDRTYDISLDKEQQVISYQDLTSGHYRINIQWLSDGTEYLQKLKVYIP